MLGETVVSFGLLKPGRTILADHHERRHEDGLEGNDEGQGLPGDLSMKTIQAANTTMWRYTNIIDPANVVMATAILTCRSFALRCIAAATTG